MYNSIDYIIQKTTDSSLADIPQNMPLKQAAQQMFKDTQLAVLFENLERSRSNKIKEPQQLHPMQMAKLILHLNPNTVGCKKQNDEWYILSDTKATPLAPLVREIDYLNTRRNTAAVAGFIQDLL